QGWLAEARSECRTLLRMLVPQGYTMRAPAPDDLTAVSALMIADELDDVGQSTLGADFVEGEWSRPGFVLETDAWVVLDDLGDVVGYAQIRRESTEDIRSWGVVHPGHRGRGIGSALLDRIQARAAEASDPRPTRLRHATNAN